MSSDTLPQTIEVWKDIESHKGIYQISNLGRVKVLNPRYESVLFLKPTLNHYGYFYVKLCNNKVYKKKTIHRLVAEAFYGDSNGLVIDHINGVKTDNRLENLEYVTYRVNAQRYINSIDNGRLIGTTKMSNGKWRAYVCFKGRQRHIGEFQTELEAHEVYNKACLSIELGEFCYDKFRREVLNKKVFCKKFKQSIIDFPAGSKDTGNHFGVHPSTVWRIRKDAKKLEMQASYTQKEQTEMNAFMAVSLPSIEGITE